MAKNLQRILRLVCLGLGALVFAQLAVFFLRRDPLARLVLPATLLPAAKAETKTGGATNVTKTNPAPPPGFPGPPTPLPPAIQARVDRITQAEVLGPVMRPPPMALLGIAGKQVFLRAPNGQTGLLGEGEQLGGIKLLRIGTNRVLIEEGGQPKELTIFAGLGGDTLLPKGKENPQ